MGHPNAKKARSRSRITTRHYIKLVVRSLMFLAALLVYVVHRIRGTKMPLGGIENPSPVLFVIWLVYLVEMIFRFFPSRVESMGCQKQFARNYTPRSETAHPELLRTRTVVLIGLGWLAFNAVFGVLYYAKIIDEGILWLISLLFGVCDLICILFFCPFQTWFMKNKCCTACRIYNWDYAMMFTPLVFLRNVFSQILVLCGVALLVRWEVTVWKHPERFSETTNQCLSCAECDEKLCHHKRQLQHFLEKHKLER